MSRPLALAAVGLLAIVGQVALLRELAVASFGVELVFLLGLGLWLAAGAAGALAGRWGGEDSISALAFGFLLFAFLLPLEIAFLRGARPLLGGIPGAFLPLGRQAAVAAIGVVPAGALLGWLFARAARGAASGGRTLAWAYAWESAGAAAGSAAATFLLILGGSNLSLALAAAAAAAALAASARPLRAYALPALVLLLALLAAGGPLDLATSRWNHAGLVAVADTPQGRVAIARAGEQVAVFANDALLFESEGSEAEVFVYLAALQAAARPRVLLLGAGAAGVVEQLLRHGPSRVDYAEGNPAMFRVLLPHLPERTRRALEDPSVTVFFEDPRLFLDRAGSYDLILVAAGEPSSGESNRFYTEEFFRLCAARLAPGGVVALRLASAENLWTPGLARRNGAVHAALRAAFPEVQVVPGATDILLGSKDMLLPDPNELASRMAERGVAGRLVTPQYLRYLFTNERMRAVAERLRVSEEPPNTDTRPVCYRQAALMWLERFSPPGGGELRPSLRLGALSFLIVVALLVLARLLPGGRGAGLAAVAGFAGMALESLVLLRFQAVSGSLYQDIGLLLTSFMAGLAAGAWAFDRLAERRAPRGWWGAALLLFLAALAGGLALGAGSAWLFRLLPAVGVLALCGALTAGVFAFASRMGGSGPAAGPLYAADLLGGCAGALLGGLFLLPLLGAAPTAAAVALLALAATLVIPGKP